MSEAPDSLPANQPARTSLAFKIALVLISSFLVLLFLPWLFTAGRMGVLVALALGWWSFLRRTLPGISWNWDLVGMAMVCSGGILLLAHGLLAWIIRNVAAARGNSRRWRWKWTWCGLGGLLVLFLVGMAVGGASHQIGWLRASHEPWYEIKPRHLGDRLNLEEIQMEVRRVLLETNTVASFRQAIWNSEIEKRGANRWEKSPVQSCHLLLEVGEHARVKGVIAFPRDEQAKSRTGGYFTTADDSHHVSPEELPAFIERHGPSLIAF